MRMAALFLSLSLWAGGPPTALELARPGMRPIGADVWVGRLVPGIWVTSFTHDLEDGTVYPANGLAMEGPTGVVLVDPGWSPAQTRALLEWVVKELHRPVRKAVVTHSHADRSAGIATLRAAGIPVLASLETVARLQARGETLPTQALALERPYCDDAGFELFFPGPGHTADNIVVWVPKARLLVGGCFLKSTTAPDLGYLGDADPEAWPASLRRLRETYPKVRLQVPGHGIAKGDAVAHTEALLRAR